MFSMPIFMIGQSIDLLGNEESISGMNIDNVHVVLEFFFDLCICKSGL